jgi:uncharacterized protein (DUF111 family)
MAGGFEVDEVFRLETNLDDCTGEILGSVMNRLLELGALDVWLEMIQMKKQRPGVMLCVLCEEGVRDALADVILTETTAFGVRVEKVQRLKLARRTETVRTEFGEVTIKLGLKGERVVQIAPEYESCRQVANTAGVPIREVYAAAEAAYRGKDS